MQIFLFSMKSGLLGVFIVIDSYKIFSKYFVTVTGVVVGVWVCVRRRSRPLFDVDVGQKVAAATDLVEAHLVHDLAFYRLFCVFGS